MGFWGASPDPVSTNVPTASAGFVSDSNYSTEEVAPGVYATTPNSSNTGLLSQAAPPVTTINNPAINTTQTQQAVQQYVAQATNPVQQTVAPITPQYSTAVNPATPGTYDSGFVTNPNYSDPFKMISIGDTGWDQSLQSQLSPYGITQVPQWMVPYGIESGFDKTDFGAGIYSALNLDPVAALSSGGKLSDAMSGWKLNDQGEIVDIWGNKKFADDPTNLAAVQQDYLNRKFKENQGGFNPLGAEGLGMAVVLAPIMAALGGYALGPAAGLAEAGGAPAASGADLIGAAIAQGAAAGADVGMGAGTSWLTDLGFPAAYGNDLASLISYGANSAFDSLGAIDIGNLIGGNLPGLISGGSLLPGMGVVSQPTNIMAGTTSAPQTSPIAQTGRPMGGTTPTITPATMPTGSIMGAFANRSGDTPDYMKYLSPLF